MIKKDIKELDPFSFFHQKKRDIDDLPINRGGVGKFSAAKAPIFATLGTGYQIGKFLGRNLLKLMGMEMKKKYKYR